MGNSRRPRSGGIGSACPAGANVPLDRVIVRFALRPRWWRQRVEAKRTMVTVRNRFTWGFELAMWRGLGHPRLTPTGGEGLLSQQNDCSFYWLVPMIETVW